MKITFLGAAQEVTGSCYLLETSTKRMLIDCGMSQGSRIADERNLAAFPFDASSIDAVAVTHAHLDHCGRIPKLVRDGFRGQVYATGPTTRLAHLIMEDSVDILARDAQKHKHHPVYEAQDVEEAKQLFVETEYYAPVELDEQVKIEFFDAGHILGSSIIRVTDGDTSIVFSGDLGNPPVPILKPTDIIDEADYVVMESTYGGHIHEDKDTRTQLLRSAIFETVKMGGVLMIPAFALERTQELLYELNHLVENNDIPDVPIFLDSPLAIKATRVFQEFESYFNTKAQEIIRTGDDVFHFPGLRMTLKTAESKAINNHPAPKIIIAGSGMAHGGRILHHIERYISFFANQYLIIGYQAHGSLGREIYDGAEEIRVHGKTIPVKAKVRAIGGYSAHADQPALTTWLSGMNQKRIKKTFLTHGEADEAFSLQKHLKREHIGGEVIVPELGASYTLE